MTEKAESQKAKKVIESKKTEPVAKPKTGPVESNKEQVVYIGPHLKYLQPYSVFRGELPQSIKELMQVNSWLKGLFVPVRQLPSAMKNLQVQGTKEFLLFEKAKKEVK